MSAAPHQLEFARTLDDAQPIEDGRKIMDIGPRPMGAESGHEGLLRRALAVQRIGRMQVARVEQRIAAHLPPFRRTVRHVDLPRLADVGQQRIERTNRVDAGQDLQLLGVVATPFAAFNPFDFRIAVGEIQRAGTGGCVDQQIGMRHFDAAKVKEFVRLAKRVERSAGRRPLQNCDAAGNRIHYFLAPSDEIGGREIVLKFRHCTQRSSSLTVRSDRSESS